MKKYSDSTLKGFTKDFLIKTIRCLENNLEDCEYRNENQFRILCQMDLERAKYRWHDLRKNPEDLPNLFTDEDTEAVLVIDDLDEYHTAYYNYHFREWLSDTNYKFEVIAWREIEPFASDINVGHKEVEE